MRVQMYAVAEYSIRGAVPKPTEEDAQDGNEKETSNQSASNLLEGALLYQSGYKAEEPREGPGWLSETSLPICRYVDRSLCAEFQLLSELIEVQVGGPPPGTQDPTARKEQKGRVDFWATHAPCL